MKQCMKCGGYYSRKFFRCDPDGYIYLTCRGCEQTARDRTKTRNRWIVKVLDTMRRHASRLGNTVEYLEQHYGWHVEQLVHEGQHAYANGCPICGKSFLEMGHGL